MTMLILAATHPLWLAMAAKALVTWLLNPMYIFACLFLIFLVVIQRGSEGDGMGAAFGGGSSDSLFGVKTGAGIKKFTSIIAAIFMLLVVTIAKLTNQGSLQDRAGDQNNIEMVEKKPADANGATTNGTQPGDQPKEDGAATEENKTDGAKKPVETPTNDKTGGTSGDKPADNGTPAQPAETPKEQPKDQPTDTPKEAPQPK